MEGEREREIDRRSARESKNQGTRKGNKKEEIILIDEEG